MPGSIKEVDAALRKVKAHHLAHQLRPDPVAIIYTGRILSVAFGVDASRMGKVLGRRPQRFKGVNWLRVKDSEMENFPQALRLAIVELPEVETDPSLIDQITAQFLACFPLEPA
jgi:MFS superfamily sulfate permease-like transporter